MGTNKTTISHDELHEALNTIQNFCKTRDCTNCELSVSSNPYRCGVTDTYPDTWKLVKPSDYKAFMQEE